MKNWLLILKKSQRATLFMLHYFTSYQNLRIKIRINAAELDHFLLINEKKKMFPPLIKAGFHKRIFKKILFLFRCTNFTIFFFKSLGCVIWRKSIKFDQNCCEGWSEQSFLHSPGRSHAAKSIRRCKLELCLLLAVVPLWYHPKWVHAITIIYFGGYAWENTLSF